MTATLPYGTHLSRQLLKSTPVSAKLGNPIFICIHNSKRCLLVHNQLENARLTDYSVYSAKGLAPMSIMCGVFSTSLYWRGIPLSYMHLIHSKSTLTLFFFNLYFPTFSIQVLSYPAFFHQMFTQTKTLLNCYCSSQHIYRVIFFHLPFIIYQKTDYLAISISTSSTHTSLNLLMVAVHTTYLKQILIYFTHISPCHSILGFIFSSWLLWRALLTLLSTLALLEIILPLAS